MTAEVKGKVMVYGAGGCGINIAALLKKNAPVGEGIAEFKIAALDTSRANLDEYAKDLDSFLIDGLDGSGAIRKENYESINKHILEILQQYKPEPLNIVVSSGAGGTGAVISALLVAELLARKQAVVVLMVGSTASRLAAENTLKTFKSYESIAQKQQAPVVMRYLQNAADLTRGEVDQSMLADIIYLGVLFSRQNKELDTKDLYNWLRFNDHSSFGPQLATLSIFCSSIGGDVNKTISRLGNIISVATLAAPNVFTDLECAPEYHTVGIKPTFDNRSVLLPELNDQTINYVVSDGMVVQYAESLNAYLNERNMASQARPARTSILGRDDAATDNGVIL